MSFSVNSGVSGPLQSIPPAASCSHTQCAWQYQSRQLPGCWSRSTVIRPSGTSTSTVGLVSANGNATYSASLSSVAGLVIRFAMSIHGSSSYSVTTVATLVQPSSLRSTTSRAPIPGSRSRSEEHTSELQSQSNLVCRLLLEKKKKIILYNNVLCKRIILMYDVD